MTAGKTILVVDDDRDILESISVILESAGHDVIAVESGEECYNILERLMPDLIVLDIMLDALSDGLAICAELKSRPGWCTIPIVLISSIDHSTGFSIDKEFLQVDEFIEKPFQPAIFLETIQKILS